MASSFTPQQIEDFLQEFFDVVGARQYIGARYVPIFGRAGEDTVVWDDGAPYEPLTVVMHDGVSYVSRRYVPAGIEITDTDYWVETYRFNAQVEQYRQEVLGFQGQIDAISQTLEDDYVPFPDPLHYPKYGTLGQVLSTLADGTVKWEDPVVPSDEQAETIITGWLDEHPEATTTVQDGSITDAKLNADATVYRMRGNVPDGTTSLQEIRGAGTWEVTTAVMANLTDMPEGHPNRTHTLMNFVYASTSSGQSAMQFIYANYNMNQIWWRYTTTSSAGPWYTIMREVTDEDLSADSTVIRLRTPTPSTITTIAELNKGGIYSIPRDLFDTLTDIPQGSGRHSYTLVNFTYGTGSGGATQYVYQLLFSGAAVPDEVYLRYIAASSTSSWVNLRVADVADGSITPAKMGFTPNVLTGKKLVTAGDSYTAALFGTSNPNTGHNFGWHIAQRNGMEFVNAGISGSIMAYDKTYVDDPVNVPVGTRNPFSYQRYLDIPADTDYLTIWFGINDASHTYLGTIDDTTSDTFYGGWNKVLEYYLTNRPFMHVGIVVTVGSTAQYRQAVRDVAAKWGYPVLDLVDGSDTPAFFDRDGMSTTARDLRRDAYGYNTWNAHPGPEWHEFISSAFEQFLKRC